MTSAVESCVERLDEAAEEQGRDDSPVGESLVGDSLAGSISTSISRLTGFVRAATIAAVLGATYFGNTFQALYSLPNLVYYQLLAGSLFVSVLVPVLVNSTSIGDTLRARRILDGFLGTMLVIATAAGALLFLGGWVMLLLMAAGVADPAVAEAQRHVGLLLLFTFVPNIVLYVITGVGAAALNAKHRFALAAGAPAVENIVIILFLVATVIVFDADTNITTVSDSQVLFLGFGATFAVVCHAALLWWGARRVGMPMTPRIGWRDSEVRQLVRRLVPGLAYTSLAFFQVVAFLVVANRVEGGVVALQLALNFFYLPLALVAWPIAHALLPQLARRRAQHTPNLFGDDFRRAVALATFVATPISVGFMILSYPLARVVAFGELRSDGVDMLALSIAALAPGVLAETWFILGTYASYAREDMRTPLRPMATRVVVSIVFMAFVLTVQGDAFVPLLGVGLTLGSLAGALHFSVLVRRTLGAGPARDPAQPGLRSTIVRAAIASLVMAVPVGFAAFAIGHMWSGKLGEVLALAVAAVVGLVSFVGMQVLMRSPELHWIKSSLVSKRTRSDVEVAFS